MTMPPARPRHERDPEAKRPKGMRERALSLRDGCPKALAQWKERSQWRLLK